MANTSLKGDWEYIVNYVIKFDPRLQEAFPEYMGEGLSTNSLSFRPVSPAELDRFERELLVKRFVRGVDQVLKSKSGLWVTPFYKDDLNPIPRSVINKCIEFSIPNYKALQPSEKLNWQKSIGRLNKAYTQYNKSLFEGEGVQSWLDYIDGLLELEGSEDYCLHH